MREPIVATGATGRAGRVVAERLLARGEPVRVVGRDAKTLGPFASRGAEVHVGSLKDRGFLTNAFRGPKAAYVLTALDVQAAEVNVDQYEKAASIARAIRDAGVSYVVVNSSWGAELTSKSGGIIGCHRLEESLGAIQDLNVVFLRPVWFMEISLEYRSDKNGRYQRFVPTWRFR